MAITETKNLQAGKNTLTPEQLLAYSRIHYVGNSDWERTDRQRKVLTVNFEKMRDIDFAGALGLEDRILPNLTTDMNNSEILGCICTVLFNRITDVESYRSPVEGTYTND